jgi:hypothetical protein
VNDQETKTIIITYIDINHIPHLANQWQIKQSPTLSSREIIKIRHAPSSVSQSYLKIIHKAHPTSKINKDLSVPKHVA